jgi:uncharacterized protein YjbI with pentapeptide repeats
MAKPSAPDPPSGPDVDDDLGDGEPFPESIRDTEIADRCLTGALPGDAGGVRIIGSRLVDVEASRADLARATLRDVVIDRGDWANIVATDASITRVRIRGVRLTGARLVRAELRDVTFEECRLDLASFRSARLDRVRFEGCRMTEVDLWEASMTSVVFERCDLTRASLTDATFDRSEIRDSELAGLVDAPRLRGVGMPWNDVLRSAAVLAGALGIRVLDG